MDVDDPHALARPLRPQVFGKTKAMAIGDPLVEPMWPGLRVLAAVGGGATTLFDEDGAAIEDHPGIRSDLTRTIGAAADGAILDGYLTKHAVTDEGGVQTWVNEYPTLGGMLSGIMIGRRRHRIEDVERRRAAEIAEVTFEEEDLVNLVLVDILWLDGQWLFDVPLLERKRVLGSILPDDVLVRTGPFVRPPIGTWIGSWRAQGFRGLTFKSANSRYRPGEAADDWATSPMPRR
jgi:hypothetical protein